MRALEGLRHRLAEADALLPLALVGIASGVVAGLVIITVRAITESSWVTLGGMTSGDDFEALAWPYRLALPVLGGLAVGLVFMSVPTHTRQVGVVHVMERLAYHAGRLPWRNAVLQFVGATLAILSGHSVGREGPAIHVGAASGSLLGQWLRLPNNSLRTLVACGTAAAIAASFNTPVAGVIFAMEVVMMEYSLIGFTPVILAAVSATSLMRIVHGDGLALEAPMLQMASLWELPYMVLVGAVLGTLASLFIRAVRALELRTRHYPLVWRTTAAGLVTGLAAIIAPQVMGLGYDTVELTLAGTIGLGALLAMAALKLVATTACIGLGVPAGLIGPTLVMGALAGAAMGLVGHELVPTHSASSGFYALLGMGAMMGATLQAPLAALMAILELAANPGSILPGMVVIVTATLTSRLVFRQDSVFITMLRARGLEYRNDPVAVALRRTAVMAVMSRRFTTVAFRCSRADMARILEHDPEWLVVAEGDRVAGVVRAKSLAQLLAQSADAEETGDELIEPAEHAEVYVALRSQATLQEALSALDEADANLALIAASSSPTPSNVYGILSRDQIESSVRYRD